MIVFSYFSCDILSPTDGKSEISGKIIDESTGAVVDNLSLILAKGFGSGLGYGGGGYKTVAHSTTDKDGNFYLFYDSNDDQNILAFYINKEPYNHLYSNSLQNISPGSKLKIQIYSVYQNTTLKVSLKFITQPKPNSFTLWFPGGGTNDTLGRTNRAKGNFYNFIRLNYTIDHQHYEVVDSVFCPIDSVTNFVLSL
jgi:hypothetical protein